MVLARLASLLRGDLPDADRVAVERLLRDPALPPGDRVKLLLPSARSSTHAASIRWPLIASDRPTPWRCNSSPFRAGATSRLSIANSSIPSIAGFSTDLFERLAGAGLDTPRPVFIIGLPGSGTTLIEQILASHPEVFGAGEVSLARDSFEELVVGPLAPRAASPRSRLRSLPSWPAGMTSDCGSSTEAGRCA